MQSIEHFRIVHTVVNIFKQLILFVIYLCYIYNINPPLTVLDFKGIVDFFIVNSGIFKSVKKSKRFS